MRITDHAYNRAYERFGWGRKQTKAFVEEACKKGKTKIRGKMHKSLKRRIRRINKEATYIVYRGIALFEVKGAIITMYRLPDRFYFSWATS